MGEKVTTIIAAPARVLVTLSARDVCRECGGLFAYELDAGVSGCAFGDTYVHTEDCKALRCPHGVPWAEWGACEECNAQAGVDYNSSPEEITEDIEPCLVGKLGWQVYYAKDPASNGYRVWESRNTTDDYETVPPEALALVLRGYESRGIMTEEGMPHELE